MATPNRTFCRRTRREFLWEAGGAFTSVALTGMLAADGFLNGKALAAHGVTALANPLAAILSAAMMMEHLGQLAEAELIRKAVLFVVQQGKSLSSDMGGSACTWQVGDAVSNALDLV